jgi:hypothetical protein
MGNLGITVGVVKKETESSVSSLSIGSISLTDATSQVFTNQDEAISYLQNFTNAPITNTSFDTVNKTLFFDVPAGTLLNLAQGFCGKQSNAEPLSFSDEKGLIVSFEANAFEGNECNNTFGSGLFFKEGSFNGATGKNVFGNENSFETNAFDSCSGTAIFGNDNVFVDFSFQYANGVKVILGNNNVINRGFYLAENNCEIIAGNENSFFNNSFDNASIIFTCGNTNNFSDYSFYESTGVVTMGNNNIIGSVSGQEFIGFFTIGNENQVRDNCFLNATLELNCGDRNEFETQCFYSASVFGFFGDENNIGIYCFQQLENSFSSTEKLTFGNRNIFNGWNFSESSNAYLDFGSSNSFFDACFFFCFNSYLKFSSNNIFRDLCFNESYNIVATFDYNSEIHNNCFVDSLNSYINMNKITTGDSFASNSTANFTIYGESTYGLDAFRNAAPTIRNVIEWIKNCGTGFAMNYTGCFEVLSKLGTTALQNLPNDFFTTSNLVSIHYPNSLEYNNAGSRDLDLLNMIKNSTNNLNYYSQYSNTKLLIAKYEGNTIITGTTLQAIASVVEIPANSLDNLCDIFLSYDYGKSTAAGIPIKVYLNTSATIAGAEQIALYTTGSNRNGGFFRKFKLRGAVLDLLSTSTFSIISNYPGDNTFVPTETKAFNRAVKNYFIITVQNDNNATVWTNKSTTVEKLKI